MSEVWDADQARGDRDKVVAFLSELSALAAMAFGYHSLKLVAASLLVVPRDCNEPVLRIFQSADVR